MSFSGIWNALIALLVWLSSDLDARRRSGSSGPDAAGLRLREDMRPRCVEARRTDRAAMRL